MSKKNQAEDNTVETPQNDAVLLALAEQQIKELSEKCDKLKTDLETVGSELNSANELIATQDAQIDHLKEIIQELEASKGTKLEVLETAVTTLKPFVNPFDDLKATLEKHKEHKIVYVKETEGGQNFSFSFRKPKDIKGWLEKTREEILSI